MRSFLSPKPTAATSNQTRLRLESLDDRIVPAAVNVTSPGSVGSIGGAFYQQFDSSDTSTDDVDPFLRLHGNLLTTLLGFVERGYNTDASLQFNAVRGNGATRTLPLADIPIVNVGGVNYREFIVDVDEPGWSPYASLEEFKVYTSNDDRLRGYNANNGLLGGESPVYDMDAQQNNWVVMDSRLNDSGYGDMRVLVPDSNFNTGDDFVYVYSNFGLHGMVHGGREEWAVNIPSVPPPPPPPPPPGNSSINGFVFYDSQGGGNDMIDDGEEVLANRVVFVDLDNNAVRDEGEQFVTSNEDGFYQLTGLTDGFHTIRVEVSGSETTHSYEIEILQDGDTEPRDIAIRPFGNPT